MSDDNEARRLRSVIANSVTLTEHFATVDKLRATEARFRTVLEAIARPTTGYQCWHIAEAKAALAAAQAQDDPDTGEQDPLPFGEAP